MATKPKTHPYAITYQDGTYLVYDLTQKDYDKISAELTTSGNRAFAVELSIGLVVLSDIRSVIKQRDPEPAPADNPNEGLPKMTPEEMAWLHQMRQIQEDEDADYYRN